MLYAPIDLSLKLFKGIPWWSSDLDSVLPLQGSIPARELGSHKPRAKKLIIIINF